MTSNCPITFVRRETGAGTGVNSNRQGPELGGHSKLHRGAEIRCWLKMLVSTVYGDWWNAIVTL